MKKIVSAWVKPAVGRYAFGTNFQKGDYIPTPDEYYAKIEGGKIIQLDPKSIRSYFGWDRISEKRLKECVVGSNAELFVSAEDKDKLKSIVGESFKSVCKAEKITKGFLAMQDNEQESYTSTLCTKDTNSSGITSESLSNTKEMALGAGLGFIVCSGIGLLFHAKKEGEVNKKVIKKSMFWGLLGSVITVTGQIILKANSNK